MHDNWINYCQWHLFHVAFQKKKRKKKIKQGKETLKVQTEYF